MILRMLWSDNPVASDPERWRKLREPRSLLVLSMAAVGAGDHGNILGRKRQSDVAKRQLIRKENTSALWPGSFWGSCKILSRCQVPSFLYRRRTQPLARA